MNPKTKPTTSSNADFDAMITELYAEGKTLPDLGRACGCMLSDRMIDAYRNGMKPKFSIADGIMRLYAETFPKKKIPAIGDA